MKKILLLLILSVVCFGQNMTFAEEPEYIDSFIEVFEYSAFADSVRFDREKEHFVAAFLFFCDEYEKECYADSTYEGYGVWVSDMDITWWDTNNTTNNTMNNTIFEWDGKNLKRFDGRKKTLFSSYHRYSHGIKTFPGFLEFLRKKEKK